jgi:hypothetical protein
MNKAKKYIYKAIELYENSIYWKERFKQFKLLPVLNKELNTKEDIFNFLKLLIEEINEISRRIINV